MNRQGFRRPSAFTLVELLVVISIIALLTAIAVPAFSVVASRHFDGEIEKIKSLLNVARGEAHAKSTYTWLLFYPSNLPQPGTLMVAAIVSADGTDPIAWGIYPNVVPDGTLQLIVPPLILSGVGLSVAGTFDAKIGSLPSTGDTSNGLNTAVQVPVKVSTLGTINFAQALRFLPSNGAGNSNPSSKFVEIDLQSFRGAIPDSKNLAVIRIDKASGSVQMYRP